MCKVSIQLKQNCRRSLRYKITCILKTDRHTDKTFVSRGYENKNRKCVVIKINLIKGKVNRGFNKISSSKI